MAIPTKPKVGYGFRHKGTGNLALMLFIGTGDNLDNYEEITEEEYKRIVAEQERKEMERAEI